MSRIVVMEEDTLMRELLVEWLSAEGHAVRRNNATTPAPPGQADLVLVDVYMPRHGGHERLRQVARQYPGVPVIAISGQFQSGVAGAGAVAHELGVRQVIAKPFSRAELLAAVRSVAGPP